jgi:tRNA (cmo5U34)-methyltransferase
MTYTRAHIGTAPAVFEAHAGGYDDDLRRRLIPPFDDFYGAAVDAIACGVHPRRRILDLGAGTGLLSGFVAQAHPGAELVLVDAAPAMLERARERLAALAGATVTLHVADLRDPFPDGPFDAIVSALAIHHLDDPGKRDLYRRAHEALSPGGVFVNAEQVRAPSDPLEGRYMRWHRDASLARGTSVQEWEAAAERMRVDRCATVEDQLAWLREAGFADPDAPFRAYRFAVLAARRAA